MKKELIIEGMSCHHCEMRVEKALTSLKEVKKAKANHLDKNCIVDLKNDVSEDILKDIVKEAGYNLIEVK